MLSCWSPIFHSHTIMRKGRRRHLSCVDGWKESILLSVECSTLEENQIVIIIIVSYGYVFPETTGYSILADLPIESLVFFPFLLSILLCKKLLLLCSNPPAIPFICFSLSTFWIALFTILLKQMWHLVMIKF